VKTREQRLAAFRKYAEDASVAFSEWADINGLTKAEGIELAERIADEVSGAAEWRDDRPTGGSDRG
jgi:hypothetical protein